MIRITWKQKGYDVTLETDAKNYKVAVDWLKANVGEPFQYEKKPKRELPPPPSPDVLKAADATGALWHNPDDNGGGYKITCSGCNQPIDANVPRFTIGIERGDGSLTKAGKPARDFYHWHEGCMKKYAGIPADTPVPASPDPNLAPDEEEPPF